MTLDITPTTGFKLGDRVTVPLRDPRNWWQRHAPRWLGGRSASMPYGEFTITAIFTSDEVIEP